MTTLTHLREGRLILMTELSRVKCRYSPARETTMVPNVGFMSMYRAIMSSWCFCLDITFIYWRERPYHILTYTRLWRSLHCLLSNVSNKAMDAVPFQCLGSPISKLSFSLTFSNFSIFCFSLFCYTHTTSSKLVCLWPIYFQLMTSISHTPFLWCNLV